MQQNKAMLLAVLFALITANTMPPPAISADNNKARIAKMKVSDIKTMSDFKEKVYQEMIPDIDNPKLADRLAFRIEKSTGVMKELWMATLDLCNKKAELAKQLPGFRKMNDPVLNAEVHNIRVFWATSELLTENFQAAQSLFEQIEREDKNRCKKIKNDFLAHGKADSSDKSNLGKQLQRHYNYMYVDTTGIELSLVGQMLTKQCKKDDTLLTTIEKERDVLKQLGRLQLVTN
jgi:hypothetical protein